MINSKDKITTKPHETPRLAGFAGRIKYIDDTELVFYLDRENDQ
jgi:hypothetical protein